MTDPDHYRVYDFEKARWVSRDPLGETNQNQIRKEGTNLYRYVLNNSVAAIDPLGLAYFAERTILGSGTENFDNLPLYHEQLFFEDGYYPENWGYLGYQGMGPDYSHGNEYTREDGPYKDCIMRKAYVSIKNFDTSGFAYNVITHNCHDWAEAVRERYWQIVENGE